MLVRLTIEARFRNRKGFLPRTTHLVQERKRRGTRSISSSRSRFEGIERLPIRSGRKESRSIRSNRAIVPLGVVFFTIASSDGLGSSTCEGSEKKASDAGTRETIERRSKATDPLDERSSNRLPSHPCGQDPWRSKEGSRFRHEKVSINAPIVLNEEGC